MQIKSFKLPRLTPSKYLPYWYLLLGPWMFYWLGAVSNIVVVTANHQRMPVRYLDDECPEGLMKDPDMLHTCFTKDTHLKVLADWLRVPGRNPDSISFTSIGDLLLTVGEQSWLAGLAAWVALILRDRYKREELE